MAVINYSGRLRLLLSSQAPEKKNPSNGLSRSPSRETFAKNPKCNEAWVSNIGVVDVGLSLVHKGRGH